MEDPVELTMRLAEIDSINPELVPGAAGEDDVADFVEAWGRERGFEVHRHEFAPGRPNVLLVRRGSGRGRSLLFNGHTDTVGVNDPRAHEVRLDDGRVYGRGVLDTKGGLAAAMVAAASFANGELRGDLIVAAVGDEEGGGRGTRRLVEEWRPDGAVALEPTDMVVMPRHRGYALIEVELTGVPAHTSRPERGVNAVHALPEVISAVRTLQDRWMADEPDPLQRATVLCNQIRTGGQLWTVPPFVHMYVEMRTAGANAHGQVQQVVDAIQEASLLVSRCEVTLERDPLFQPDDHPLVQATVRALQQTGLPGAIDTAPYFTDAAYHAAAGTPAVVLGPCGEGLHENLEWVTVESLHQCAYALAALASDWCGLSASAG